MNYGDAPAAVKISSCIDSSPADDNTGTDFTTESNLSDADKCSDDNFEINRNSNSENNNDFLNTKNEPSSSKRANETLNSGVSKRNLATSFQS